MTIATPPTRTLKSNDPCWCGSGRKYKRCHKVGEGRLTPGAISPRLAVPADIPRPDYADTGVPLHRASGLVRSADVIERMRVAGPVAARILAAGGAAVAPGVTTDALDVLVHDLCIDAGGYPSPLNYRNFPKSLCTSVNEVICHGIPDDRPLEDGDIVNLDVTIFLDGVHADCNATFAVGEVDPESARLIRVTHECLMLAIDEVKPGAPLNAIGRAIQRHAEANRFGVVRDFVGHGVCDTFHCDPQVPHYYVPGLTTTLQPGMTFTIEPMITMGTHSFTVWPDQWTAVTKDGRRTAQFEHTVLVTDDGVEVLTA